MSLIVKLLLLVAAFSIIYGHLYSPHLDPFTNYISDYAATAYRWHWISISMALFGTIYLLLAFSSRHFLPHSVHSNLAGMSLSMAGLCMFFVAHYPTTRYGKRIAIFDGDDMWRKGWDQAYSNAHFDMISVSLWCLVAGMLAISIHCLRKRSHLMYAKTTIILLIVMGALFVLGNQCEPHGLYQRLGFALNWSWLWMTASCFAVWKNESAL